MDDPGWRARYRADKEEERRPAPQRGPDGRYQPVEQIYPVEEPFVGGFARPPSFPVPQPGPPAVPPKDGVWLLEDGQTHAPQITLSDSAQMSAVERSKNLRVRRMDPYLQFMAGPLLRYDTVDEQGVWRGAAMIITADAGSTYEPYPTLTFLYDPASPGSLSRTPSKLQKGGAQAYELGPHPADPNSNMPVAVMSEAAESSATLVHRQVPGQEIWVYNSNGGTFTFWRFMIEIPLAQNEMRVYYSVNGGQQFQFYVPGRTQNMRWAAYSCNGFSAGVNADDFCGPGFRSGYDPVWTDLLAHHAEEPFHALVGGGDQLYCDGIVREPELQEWVKESKPEKKRTLPVTGEMLSAIDRFYFNHYCQVFRSGAFARANSSIPMLNMLALGFLTSLVLMNHIDLIDGFGSYPDDLMMSPVFRTIGSRGYFFFLLFQCFINVEIDGLDDLRHPFKSLIIGGNGPFIPFPSHSFLAYLGPQTHMLLLDCRAERKKSQVCSQEEYTKVFSRVSKLPPTAEHLVIQIGIPIAYPRMVFLETALDSKFNPLVALGRSGAVGLAGFVNKFNADAELLDDLNDHWTAKGHKKERNWFIEETQKIAQAKHIRISFLSGDVHCAAVGVFKTLRKGKNAPEIQPPMDHRYMLNIVSSAIVNTAPPNAVLTMVATLASKTHKTLHHADTDESMVPLFDKDPNGTAAKSKYIMGKRNWCSARWDPASGDMVFDIRVEIEKGHGTTAGYAVRAPPPRWSR
ncbi:hypothetical protein CERSUDRAFT_97712 [Gelatoporia subvermispora B]|uniref:PhoD-like phosphatase domain-containing protein n=1 Tax=Ceriporiopsis subvermispora (strain B) TaxID=914234 RepID=M2QQM4_CERS8|nr:hypothetical protein CERSUDRAFT_97712 [Gelatoporia subvermispora B]